MSLLSGGLRYSNREGSSVGRSAKASRNNCKEIAGLPHQTTLDYLPLNIVKQFRIKPKIEIL